MTASVALDCLLWIGGLALALAASEALVQLLGLVGMRVHLAAGLLGVLVALGADAPEVTSAITALQAGSTDVGLGVVLGSNIYNLAGMLGLSALLAGSLSTDRGWMTTDMSINALITILILVLLEVSGLQTLTAAVACLLFAFFAVGVTLGRPTVLFGPAEVPAGDEPRIIRTERQRTISMPVLLLLLLVAVLCIVGGSEVLVRMSLRLGPTFDIPPTVVGTFVLAIATSLPNTWAAVSLTRRGQAASAIAATFSSNTINLVAAVAIPALFLNLHPAAATRGVVAFWLAGMTVAAVALLATRHALSRRDGVLLLSLYGLFVVSRLFFG